MGGRRGFLLLFCFGFCSFFVFHFVSLFWYGMVWFDFLKNFSFGGPTAEGREDMEGLGIKQNWGS